MQAESTVRLTDIRSERKRDKRVKEIGGRKRREGATVEQCRVKMVGMTIESRSEAGSGVAR